MKTIAFGIKRERDNTILDTWYPVIMPDAENIIQTIASIMTPKSNTFIPLTTDQLFAIAALIPSHITTIEQLSHAAPKTTTYAHISIGMYTLDTLDSAVSSVEEGYLKLQLISHRHVRPHELNLTNIFSVLNNIAWTNKGPILPKDLDKERIASLAAGHELVVSHIDKFPYLVNYHIPNGVRIASGSQVRLGAYLGEGTTIMPAGYVNFNAGTIGNAMVEGRISAGVVVKENSDIGGGASIMGTLSGGNKETLSVGTQCLLGANSGIGISLGNGCTVEAGLYITAGMKILDQTVSPEKIVKAHTLSGKNNVLFIKDSQNGQIICKPNPHTITLNETLHQND